MMFGMMGQFLPAAARRAASPPTPCCSGIGALFGGMGLSEDRKRKVQMRRQTARTQVRQFLDDVQFEVTNQITRHVRDVQRELRDEFARAARPSCSAPTPTPPSAAQEDAPAQDAVASSAQREIDAADAVTREGCAGRSKPALASRPRSA